MQYRLSALFFGCLLLAAPLPAQDEAAEPEAGPAAGTSEPAAAAGAGEPAAQATGDADGEAAEAEAADAGADAGETGAAEARAADDEEIDFTPSEPPDPDFQAVLPVDF